MFDLAAQDRAEEAKAGNSAIEGLERVLVDFDNYYRWMDKANGGKLNEQGVDVRKRIVQVRLILQLLNAALAETRTIGELGDNAAIAAGGESDMFAAMNSRVEAQRPYLKRSVELGALVELYSETFYLFAARAMSAARHLPGLKSLKAPGVTNVRNHLIEHTEGEHSRVFNGGFGYGKPRGPVLAAVRTSETPDVWHDPGLFVNAEEYSGKFSATLRAALQASVSEAMDGPRRRS